MPFLNLQLHIFSYASLENELFENELTPIINIIKNTIIPASNAIVKTAISIAISCIFLIPPIISSIPYCVLFGVISSS